MTSAGTIGSVILKVASRCNLNCSYCYVYNHADQAWRARPRFMADDVYEATLLRMREHCDRHEGHRISICYHGGEPMLVGASRFDALVDRARAVLGDRLRGVSIQTNAILVDSAWIEVFQRHRVGVGVSLDGPAEIHDATRVDHAGRGSHAATVAGLERLQDAGLDPAVLCVVNPSAPGLAIYDYVRSLGVKQINFLPPDVSHDHKARLYGTCGATPLADYLLPILDAWWALDDPSIRVRPFWDLVHRILGGEGATDLFGNRPLGYLIVETGGSIEALDALRVCEEGIAVSGLHVTHHGFDDLSAGGRLVHRTVTEGFPLPTPCRACPEQQVCGGGFLPHRYSRARGFDNESVWCADILKILARLREHIAEGSS